MKTILLYLLQVTISSGILYSYYHFFLRNKKFHRYNRFYLLGATAISLLIPFLQIPLYFTQQEAEASILYKTLKAMSVSKGENITIYASAGSWINYLTVQNFLLLLYLAVSVFLLMKFTMAINKIHQLLKKHSIEKWGIVSLVKTNEPGTPFSFFRLLFWNKKIDLQSQKGQQIFRHEWFHIQQKHSWDIILMEILNIFLWINPFFYLIKKS